VRRKKISISIVILVCLFSVTIGILAIWYYTKEDKLTSEAKLFVGKEMNINDFEKNTFQNNQKSIDINHKLWVIYLLSTCEACNDELRFAEHLDDNPTSQIKVVGIMGEEESTVQEFIEEHNIKFPILLDRNRKFVGAMKLRYFPTNFIVNNGKIEKVIFGSPQDKSKLSEFIK
jgi:peroxiredoxin